MENSNEKRSELKNFFKIIQGYLIGDLTSMSLAKAGKGRGGCGYPMVQTIMSGYELLGQLLYPNENNYKSFESFIDNNLPNQYKGKSPIFRHLLRNPISHVFLTSPHVLIAKNQGKNLTKDDEGRLFIEVIELFNDFKKSFLEIKKTIDSTGDDNYIEMIWENYKNLVKNIADYDFKIEVQKELDTLDIESYGRKLFGDLFDKSSTHSLNPVAASGTAFEMLPHFSSPLSGVSLSPIRSEELIDMQKEDK